MGSIRSLKGTGKLFFDFRYKNKRCREYTDLADNTRNRKAANKILDRIEKEIAAGTFDYGSYFPNSKMIKRIQPSVLEPDNDLVMDRLNGTASKSATSNFKAFSDLWYEESEIAWRNTHKKTVRDIMKKHLIPAFGLKEVGCITKAEIKAFRSSLAKVPGRKDTTLSAKRINAIMGVLRQILNEATDRFDFITPYRNIKPLKVKKSDVQPFSLEEVNLFLNKVRQDYRHYYTVRFFTGMRTGEIDGLKWRYIDFEKRLILVRETIVAGQTDYTKTDGSQREIQMSGPVYSALASQQVQTGSLSKYVFCNREGQPLDHNNVTKRIWYPLLRHLGLEKRTPYQTRHTAATLWLAAGESPEWIARQMGHTSTEMLFRVYSRYVPNLTRQDGSAFDRLLTSRLELGVQHGEL